MNNHIPDWLSLEVEQLITTFTDPPPRQLPPELRKLARKPIATFMINFGIFWLFFPLIFLTLWLLGLLKTNGQPTSITTITCLMGALYLMPTCMIGWGLLSRRTTNRILTQGRLTPATVTKTSQLPSRNGTRSFYRITVQLESPNNQTVTASDSVNDLAIEYFLNAKADRNPVLALYTPDTPKQIVLLAKIAYAKRYN